MIRLLILGSAGAACLFGLLAQSAAGSISIPQTIGYTTVCGVLLTFATAAIRYIVKMHETRIEDFKARLEAADARIEDLETERDRWQAMAQQGAKHEGPGS